MLRKTIFTILLCTFASASQDFVYSASKKNRLEGLFSSKQAKLFNNLYINFNLGSALVILDSSFAMDNTKNSPKRLNPEKTLLTLSYRF